MTRNRKIALGLLPAIALLLAAWWLLSPDPVDVFYARVDSILDLANEGRHSRIADYASPELAEHAAQNYMPLPRVLLMINRMDRQQVASYSRGNLNAFYPRDYAEIVIHRSVAGREKSVAVPFIYRNGKWWVASALRDSNRGWTAPW